jgi:hypothetical protein
MRFSTLTRSCTAAGPPHPTEHPHLCPHWIWAFVLLVRRALCAGMNQVWLQIRYLFGRLGVNISRVLVYVLGSRDREWTPFRLISMHVAISVSVCNTDTSTSEYFTQFWLPQTCHRSRWRAVKLLNYVPDELSSNHDWDIKHPCWAFWFSSAAPGDCWDST